MWTFWEKKIDRVMQRQLRGIEWTWFARLTNARGWFVPLVRNSRSFRASSPTKVTIIVDACIYDVHRYADRGARRWAFLCTRWKTRHDEDTGRRETFGRIGGNHWTNGEGTSEWEAVWEREKKRVTCREERRSKPRLLRARARRWAGPRERRE